MPLQCDVANEWKSNRWLRACKQMMYVVGCKKSWLFCFCRRPDVIRHHFYTMYPCRNEERKKNEYEATLVYEWFKNTTTAKNITSRWFSLWSVWRQHNFISVPHFYSGRSCNSPSDDTLRPNQRGVRQFYSNKCLHFYNHRWFLFHIQLCCHRHRNHFNYAPKQMSIKKN